MSLLLLFAAAPALSGAQSSDADTAAPATTPPAQKIAPIDVQGKKRLPYATDVATGAAKMQIPLIEIPQSVSVVSRELMDAQNVQSLSDVLRYVAGVQPQTAGRRGFDDFIIRGFSQSAYAFRDGLRIDPGFFTEQETFGLERVEIIKGPGSVLFGQVAPGGLVNMVAKRPTLGSKESRVNVELGAGSFNAARGAADVSGPIDTDATLAYRTLFLLADRNDAIDSVGASRHYFSPSLSWQIGANTQLTFLSLYQRDEFTRALALPARGTVLANPNGTIARTRFLGEPDFDRLRLPQWQIGYEFSHRFNDLFKFTQNLRRTGYELTGQNLNVGTVSANGQTITRNPIFLDIDNDITAVDNQFSANVRTGVVRHQLLAGFDYLRFRNRQTQRVGSVAPLNLFAPVYGAAINPATNFSNNRRQVQSQEGIYVQNHAKISDTFVLLAGVRRDSVRDDTTTYLTSARAIVNQSATTSRAGAVYLAPLGLAPYVSYSQSFVPVVANALRDGTSVKPEEGEQIEAGLKFGGADGTINATLSWFDLKRRNVVSADPANTAFSVQTGEQRHKGVELEANARLASFVDVVFAYSTLDAIVTASTSGNQGKRPQNTPRRMASIWTTWRFDSLAAVDTTGLDFSIGARHVGERYGDALNTYQVPGYTVFDAGIRYATGAWTLGLNARNLGDKDYFIATTAGTNVSVGEKRTFVATAKYAWR